MVSGRSSTVQPMSHPRPRFLDDQARIRAKLSSYPGFSTELDPPVDLYLSSLSTGLIYPTRRSRRPQQGEFVHITDRRFHLNPVFRITGVEDNFEFYVVELEPVRFHCTEYAARPKLLSLGSVVDNENTTYFPVEFDFAPRGKFVTFSAVDKPKIGHLYSCFTSRPRHPLCLRIESTEDDNGLVRAQVSEVYSDFERGERKGPRKDYGPDNLPYRPPAITRRDVEIELGRFRRLYDPESWTVHGAQDEETLFMVEDPDGSRAVFIGKKDAWLHMTKEKGRRLYQIAATFLEER